MNDANSNTTPLVWVLATEVVRCATLSVDTWRELRTEDNEANITKWMGCTTGWLWKKRHLTRDEATRAMERDDPYRDLTPKWVEETVRLGRAALLAAPGTSLHLSPQQISWLWPEIDPRPKEEPTS